MDRNEFLRKVDEIAGAPELCGMSAAVIALKGGEEVLTQVYTIRDFVGVVHCLDVHATPVQFFYEEVVEVRDACDTC